MIFLVLIIVVASCSVKTCSDLVSCPTDDSSEESTEGPIVDVGVGVPGRRKRKGRQPTRRPRNMGDESTIKTTAAMSYARGGAGGNASKGSGGSGGGAPCPGSLEDCIVACPTEVARVYTLCVANCGRVCGNK